MASSRWRTKHGLNGDYSDVKVQGDLDNIRPITDNTLSRFQDAGLDIVMVRPKKPQSQFAGREGFEVTHPDSEHTVEVEFSTLEDRRIKVTGRTDNMTRERTRAYSKTQSAIDRTKELLGIE